MCEFTFTDEDGGEKPASELCDLAQKISQEVLKPPFEWKERDLAYKGWRDAHIADQKQVLEAVQEKNRFSGRNTMAFKGFLRADIQKMSAKTADIWAPAYGSFDAPVAGRADVPGKTCPKCQKHYEDDKEYKHHYFINCVKPIKCEVCDKAYMSKPSLKTHEKISKIHKKKLNK